MTVWLFKACFLETDQVVLEKFWTEMLCATCSNRPKGDLMNLWLLHIVVTVKMFGFFFSSVNKTRVTL